MVAVERHPAARHDAVDVGMVQERLRPGVQDGQKTDRSAQMTRIGSDLE